MTPGFVSGGHDSGWTSSVLDDNCPAAVQDLMQTLLPTHNLTGVQIAVAPNGVLTCAGALGYAGSTTQRPMTPTTLMRIGSVSKTITGMAIAKLFEDGKLGLDDKAIDYVKDLQPANGPPDARWRNVTIRNVLQHSMGWTARLVASRSRIQ